MDVIDSFSGGEMGVSIPRLAFRRHRGNARLIAALSIRSMGRSFHLSFVQVLAPVKSVKGTRASCSCHFGSLGMNHLAMTLWHHMAKSLTPQNQ